MVAAVSFRKRYCGIIVLFLLFCFLIFYSLIDDQMQNPYLQSYSPVVGWEFNRSRNATDYIIPEDITSIIAGRSICSNQNPPEILLIVCSSTENFALRNAIRNTWAYFSHKKFNITVAFLMGVSADMEINKQIEEESEKFDDVIVENFMDTYNNLTLKTLMLLKWVKNNCNTTSYVMKTDDDVYINIDNLIQFVDHNPKENSSDGLYGQLICASLPITDINSKWYMPSYLFSETFYPNYISGYGYLMSTSVALRLYEEAFYIPIIHMEDVFITGLCAGKAKIQPSEPYLFRRKQSNGIKCTPEDKTLIVYRHEISYEDMFLIHHYINNCDKVEFSIFDWLFSTTQPDENLFQQNKYSCAVTPTV